MGRSPIGAEAFNCAAPDTGNMEVLLRYGSPEQQRRWLLPLLNGEIRSCFAMTEPAVASSDARNIQTAIDREGDEYVISGRKFYISGAGDPRCKVCILMGKTTSPSGEREQTMVVFPMPIEGMTVVRPMHVMGFDDAPHGHMEILFDRVRVPVSPPIVSPSSPSFCSSFFVFRIADSSCCGR
jgi:acyl-CoA dehydrogenase